MVAFPVHLRPDLPGTIDTDVVLVHLGDDRHQFRIPHRTRRGRPALGGVVTARGDLNACGPQDLDDRLDSERFALHNPITVGVDVTGNYFSWRSSSAAAKKADAVRSISLALFSSLISPSSDPIRSASALVVPARIPSSTSACRTHLRSLNRMHPQLLRYPLHRTNAGVRIAPQLDRHRRSHAGATHRCILLPSLSSSMG